MLARWGGLGNHRYQVGFSGGAFAPAVLPLPFAASTHELDLSRLNLPPLLSPAKTAALVGICSQSFCDDVCADVNPLAWNSFAYQPYFSATASNVGYGFWSHDIEGPGDDHELCATPIPQP